MGQTNTHTLSSVLPCWVDWRVWCVWQLHRPSVLRSVRFEVLHLFYRFLVEKYWKMRFSFKLIHWIIFHFSPFVFISIIYLWFLTFSLVTTISRMKSLVVNTLVYYYVKCATQHTCVSNCMCMSVCVSVQHIKLSACITTSMSFSCCCCLRCCCCCFNIYICVLFLLQRNTCLAYVWVHVNAYVFQIKSNHRTNKGVKNHCDIVL